jgi:hypothetical protein
VQFERLFFSHLERNATTQRLLSVSFERTASGPLWTIYYLRPWAAADASRRAVLQSQVPPLTEQCDNGSCCKICTTNSAKRCHLFLQPLGHSASTSLIPIRLGSLIGDVVSCLNRSSVMSHRRRNTLRIHGPLLASTFSETSKHRIVLAPEAAGVCISGGKPRARCVACISTQTTPLPYPFLFYNIPQNHDCG